MKRLMEFGAVPGLYTCLQHRYTLSAVGRLQVRGLRWAGFWHRSGCSDSENVSRGDA